MKTIAIKITDIDWNRTLRMRIIHNNQLTKKKIMRHAANMRFHSSKVTILTNFDQRHADSICINESNFYP